MKIIIYYLCGFITACGAAVSVYNTLLVWRDLVVGINETAHFTIAIICFILAFICGVVADKIEQNL